MIKRKEEKRGDRVIKKKREKVWVEPKRPRRKADPNSRGYCKHPDLASLLLFSFCARLFKEYGSTQINRRYWLSLTFSSIKVVYNKHG
jgi:hypothetical protein